MSFTIHEEIGMRLCALRERDKEKSLKQKDLADLLGITPAAYGKLELGTRRLSPEYCITLADFYGVSCDYILRGVEATNLDICAETCLQQSTIDDLKAKKKQFQDAHDKKHEMLKDPRPLGLEGMSLLFGLGPKMNYYVVEEHIINSFFSKDWLSSELSDAVLMGIEGVIGEIDEGVQMKSMIGDWFNCNTLSLYRKTAAYSASQVFSKYFMEIFTDAKLIRKLEVLPEEDIQAAIERGLLHE